VFSVLGDIYRNQGRWAEADECYQRSLASITATGNPQSLFVVNLGLGLINMERKRYSKAEEFFQKCWAIASKGVGFTTRMATVQAYMGELYVRIGNLQKAEEHVRRALELAREAEARQELAYATMVQGMIAARRREWDAAIEHYSQALKIFEELEDKYHQGKACFEIGMMYREKGESKADRQQSRHYLERARRIFTELGAKADLNRFPPDL